MDNVLKKNWAALKQGDIVDIIAPGYGASPRALKAAADYLKSLGLEPRAHEEMLGEDLFSSNTEEKRLAFLCDALYAHDSKAVWCLKGGYGTAALLPALTELPPPENVKLLIGYSDITSLHSFINQYWGWSTIHGSVLWQIIRDKVNKESLDRLTDLIFGRCELQSMDIIQLNDMKCPNIESTVVGGNLKIIQTTIGTPWQVNSIGKILLLEDTDEKPYEIERMLLHLEQTGVFDGAEAVLFGDFTGHDSDKDAEITKQVHERFAENAPVPVFKIPGVGHDPTNYPVPLYTKAVIMDNTLICESGFKEP